MMKHKRIKQAKQQAIPQTHNKYLIAFWIPLALIAINLFVYYQVCNFEFIEWDDPSYVSQNAVIAKGLTWQGILWAFSTGHAANWHPLTWISHMIDVQLFGVDAGFHHFINVLFHIANTLLLFRLLFRMTTSWAQSAFVAGLFAVHPLHVESVAWIAERKDVLSTLFFMLTLFAYLAYLRRPALRRYLLLAGSFALALMAKPMIVTLPFVLLLLDIWPLRRASLAAGQRRAWLQLIREKAPLIAMAIASSAVTIAVQWRFGSVPDTNLYPLGFRIANATISYIAYIGNMLWPRNLCLFYPLPEHSLPLLWVTGSILLFAGIMIAAIGTARRHPHFLVGWLWYVGTLVPVIGLIQAGSQARADRYTYIPLIGLFIVAAWGIPSLLGRRRYCKILLATGAGAIICALAIVARAQTGYWLNAVIPWEHALESTAPNYYAFVNAGLALESRGEIARAIDYYNEALHLNPNYAIGHNALGKALLRQNQLDPAIEALNNALRLQPDFVEAHSNVGAALMKLGKTEEGIHHFETALKIDPNYAQGYYNLGLALARTGKIDEAFVRFAEVLKLAPDFAAAHAQLGNVLLYKKHYDEAIAHYQEALRLNPDDADSRDKLSIALRNREAQAKQPQN
jgi:protein O-mannosyl-transferase